MKMERTVSSMTKLQKDPRGVGQEVKPRRGESPIEISHLLICSKGLLSRKKMDRWAGMGGPWMTALGWWYW
jgi:hypothetical protein